MAERFAELAEAMRQIPWSSKDQCAQAFMILGYLRSEADLAVPTFGMDGEVAYFSWNFPGRWMEITVDERACVSWFVSDDQQEQSLTDDGDGWGDFAALAKFFPRFTRERIGLNG